MAKSDTPRLEDGVLRSHVFDPYLWLEHGFATRLSSSWPDPGRTVMLRQVHSTVVVAATGGSGYIGEGDALITNEPGLMVGIRTADCVPILIADPVRRAVGAIHAGWRGTADRIVECSISAMTDRFGTVASDLVAAIGPSIGECCYEVGADVAARFVPWWPELAGVTGPVKIDLEETNRRQLLALGIPASQVSTDAPCTFCSEIPLESFRRDKEKSGRMIAAIGIRKER